MFSGSSSASQWAATSWNVLRYALGAGYLSHSWRRWASRAPPAHFPAGADLGYRATGGFPKSEPVNEGGSMTGLESLARTLSLREVRGRLNRETLRIGIRGINGCCCRVSSGTGPESMMPHAHESRCGVYGAASLAVESVTVCICRPFIESLSR